MVSAQRAVAGDHELPGISVISPGDRGSSGALGDSYGFVGIWKFVETVNGVLLQSIVHANLCLTKQVGIRPQVERQR
jgi:hypothetical protein